MACVINGCFLHTNDPLKLLSYHMLSYFLMMVTLLTQKKRRSSKWGSGHNGHVYNLSHVGGISFFWNHLLSAFGWLHNDSFHLPPAMSCEASTDRLVGIKAKSTQNLPELSGRFWTDVCFVEKSQCFAKIFWAHLFKQLVFWCQDQFTNFSIRFVLRYPFASAGIDLDFCPHYKPRIWIKKTWKTI